MPPPLLPLGEIPARFNASCYKSSICALGSALAHCSSNGVVRLLWTTPHARKNGRQPVELPTLVSCLALEFRSIEGLFARSLLWTQIWLKWLPVLCLNKSVLCPNKSSFHLTIHLHCSMLYSYIIDHCSFQCSAQQTKHLHCRRAQVPSESMLN